MTRTAIPDDDAGVPTGESAAEDEPLPYDLKSKVKRSLMSNWLLIGGNFRLLKLKLALQNSGR